MVAAPNTSASDATGLPMQPSAAAFDVPADLVRDDEIVILLLRPSILYVPLSSIGSLMFILIVTLALMWMTRLAWVKWTDVTAGGLGLALAALRLGWQALEWWSRVYVLTDRRIIRRMGVLRVSVFECQLKNIQHTSVFMLVRERLFVLGSIGFSTAGSDTFEAFWVMIRRPFDVHRIVVQAIERYGRMSGR
jgi:hypothetical protein